MNIKEVIKKDKSKVYRANVYLGIDAITGKNVRTSITAKTKKAVETKARRAVNDFVNNGCTRVKKTSHSTFHDLMVDWWNNQRVSLKNNTIRKYEGDMEYYITPAFGSFKLDKMTTALIQKQVNEWGIKANNADKYTKGAAKNYNMLLNIVSRVFKYGISIGAVSSNPASDVLLPKKKRSENKKIKYLNESQLKIFYDHINMLPNTDDNAFDVTLYKLLLATGLRISEALALDWADIDFDNATLSVSKTLDSKGNLENTPKTDSSVRDITVDYTTLLMLKLYRNRQRKLFASYNLKPNGVVFSSIFRKYVPSSALYYSLQKHYTGSDLDFTGFHVFRHTHASLLLNAGVGYKEIQHRLGHAHISITMDTYGHLSKENARAVVDVFDKAVNNLSLATT